MRCLSSSVDTLDVFIKKTEPTFANTTVASLESQGTWVNFIRMDGFHDNRSSSNPPDRMHKKTVTISLILSGL